MPVGEFTAIVMTTPLVVTLLAALFLKEAGQPAALARTIEPCPSYSTFTPTTRNRACSSKRCNPLLEAVRGGVLAVPTDSSYALVCHLDDKAAADRLRRIRQVDDKHHLTLLCRDLSELASYARVDNRQYRLLKQATPGPYTFILEASKEVPRRLSHPSRKTIGLRVPSHNTCWRCWRCTMHRCWPPP
jgi:tRNA A37 threonylcarbamoyladenosine synthetase subunit TsaC/SUA5/YrdC